jgi:hypothetical protein
MPSQVALARPEPSIILRRHEISYPALRYGERQSIILAVLFPLSTCIHSFVASCSLLAGYSQPTIFAIMADPAPLFHSLPPEQQQNLLNGPGLKPPSPDIIPQYYNPPNGDSVAHGAFAASVILTSTFITFAVYVKVTQFKGINLEDSMQFFPLWSQVSSYGKLILTVSSLCSYCGCKLWSSFASIVLVYANNIRSS